MYFGCPKYFELTYKAWTALWASCQLQQQLGVSWHTPPGRFTAWVKSKTALCFLLLSSLSLCHISESKRNRCVQSYPTSKGSTSLSEWLRGISCQWALLETHKLCWFSPCANLTGCANPVQSPLNNWILSLHSWICPSLLTNKVRKK